MRRAWLTLAAVSAVTAAGIAYVHASQVAEREALHAGVLRDDQLLAAKRAEMASIEARRKGSVGTR